MLDAERTATCCFVVNEWGSGTSLDIMLGQQRSALAAAWGVDGQRGGRLDRGRARARRRPRAAVARERAARQRGSVRIIGFCVDAALHGLPPGDPQRDVVDLAGLLHATLTGRWAGRLAVRRTAGARGARPGAPAAAGAAPAYPAAGRPLRRAAQPARQKVRDVRDMGSARGIQSFLAEFVGDPSGLGRRSRPATRRRTRRSCSPAVPEILARPHPDDWAPPARIR